MPQIGKQSWFAELQRTYTRFLKASIPIEGRFGSKPLTILLFLHRDTLSDETL